MSNEEFKIVNVMGGHEESVDALTGGDRTLGGGTGDGTPGDGTPYAGSSVDGSSDGHYDDSGSEVEFQTKGVANVVPSPDQAPVPPQAQAQAPAEEAYAAPDEKVQDANANDDESVDDSASACESANTMTTASLIANGCLYTILEQMLATPVKGKEGEEEDAPKRNMAYILNEIRIGIEQHTAVQQRIADTLDRIAGALPAAGTESEEESS
jgi:hypothetical protein